MQTASPRVWTRLTKSTSHDGNRYATITSTPMLNWYCIPFWPRMEPNNDQHKLVRNTWHIFMFCDVKLRQQCSGLSYSQQQAISTHPHPLPCQKGQELGLLRGVWGPSNEECRQNVVIFGNALGYTCFFQSPHFKPTLCQIPIPWGLNQR